MLKNVILVHTKVTFSSFSKCSSLESFPVVTISLICELNEECKINFFLELLFSNSYLAHNITVQRHLAPLGFMLSEKMATIFLVKKTKENKSILLLSNRKDISFFYIGVQNILVSFLKCRKSCALD